jgi:hypothetical protein
MRVEFRLFLTLVLSTAALAAGSSEITLRVLDARNGHPIANEHLVVSVGASPQDVQQQKHHFHLRTDANGVAKLTIAVPDVARIQVWVDFHVLCQKNPNSNSFSISEIEKTGLSTPNNCGRSNLPNTPQQLTVFARPAHWWEKMRW